MKFFYTGASKYNVPQQFANMSLGGFVSSTEIPNDFLGNIFGDESRLAVCELKRTAVLIALVNEDDERAESVNITFNVSDWTKLTGQFSIAFVSPKIDNCGNISFDKINDTGALPYITLDVLSATNNSFNLGDIQKGQVVGIWLVREIEANDNTNPLSPQQLYANYLKTDYTDPNTGITYHPFTVPTEEDFSLDLVWNEDESDSNSSS